MTALVMANDLLVLLILYTVLGAPKVLKLRFSLVSVLLASGRLNWALYQLLWVNSLYILA